MRTYSNSKQDSRNQQISAVDLFCGAGGLTYGLTKAGIKVTLGIDNDPSCQYPYSVNNDSRFLQKCITKVDAEDVASAFLPKSKTLLAGCAPCQTFSTYFQKANPNDDRWSLLSHFGRLVSQVLPDLVTMENVPGLVRTGVFAKFVKKLKGLKYFVSFSVVDCALVGVPQHRRRLVLLASRLGSIKLETSHWENADIRTVRAVIEDLPRIRAGSRDTRDPLHQASALSELNLRRIKASRPGGNWSDWTNELISKCHKKNTGKTYAGVYGRMQWDVPAPTITTQFYGYGNGRFGHPEQDRGLSLREGAMLQGFPKKYCFVPPNQEISKKVIGRLVGNAVPVPLGIAIGRTMIKHIGSLDDN